MCVHLYTHFLLYSESSLEYFNRQGAKKAQIAVKKVNTRLISTVSKPTKIVVVVVVFVVVIFVQKSRSKNV